MTALEFFNQKFASITVELAYDSAWSSLRTGFDFAVYRDNSPKFAYGKMLKSTSTEGQKLILISTRFGNVVVYQRFSPGKGLLPALGVNCTKYLRKGGWVRKTEPDIEDLKVLLGDEDQLNIGERIEELKILLVRKN